MLGNQTHNLHNVNPGFGPGTHQLPVQVGGFAETVGAFNRNAWANSPKYASMRMLVPQELKLIQGFPPEYVIDRTSDGRRLTQEQQIARIGNSVCPEMARVLVAANSPPRRRLQIAA